MRNKSLLAVAVLSTAILCCAGLVAAQGVSVQDLQAQIAKLMAQLQTIQSQQQGATTPVWCHTFSGYLTAGLTDATANGEVSFLQTALAKSGFDVSGDSQGMFGDATAAAVVQFQGKNQIIQTGTVNLKTKTQLNALYGCAPGQTPTPTTIVTPQIQTPTVVTPVTAPANSALCNGAYYSQCPTGSNFVCPSSGAAYCQPQQTYQQQNQPTQNQYYQPQSYTSTNPQQSGATPPPDCVGKTATTPNLPQDCQIYFGLMQQPNNQQPPASCNGHMPTDANLPADCAAWNAAHPAPTMNQTTCTQGGGTWSSTTNFCTFPNQPNQPSNSFVSGTCGGPGQVWCPSPAGTGGWCQLPPCPATTSQSGSSQTGQTTSNMSPQQSGATPPPDCVGKTATTPNLPQDCQIYFGLIRPTGSNVSPAVTASFLDAVNGVLKQLKSLFPGQ